MRDFQATAPHHRVLFLRFEDAIVKKFPCEIKDLALRKGVYEQFKRWKAAGYFCYGFLAPGVFEESDLTIKELSDLVKKADRLATSRVNGERFLLGVQTCLHLSEDDCFCKPPTHGLLTQAVYTIMQFTKFRGMVRQQDCTIVGDPKLDMISAMDIGAEFLDSDCWLTDDTQIPRQPVIAAGVDASRIN